MEDIHKLFTDFKAEFPDVQEKNEELGQFIHTSGGPLDEKTRWLVKLAMSGASAHHRAVATHIHAARVAGASEEEIKHTLLLLIPTCGFPAFMEAYGVYREQ